MDNKSLNYEEISPLADKVMQLSRSSLMVPLRFMDSAIGHLKTCPDYNISSICVDGRHIFYNPVFILKSYKKSKELTVRQYFHMVLHCIFLHFFAQNIENRRLWNLACDIAVENIINDLDLPCTSTKENALQSAELSGIRRRVRYMNAEFIYRLLIDTDISPEDLNRMEDIFRMDDHSNWSISRNKTDDTADSDSSNGSEIQYNNIDYQQQNSDETNQLITYDPFEHQDDDIKTLEIQWKDISKSIQVDLETFSKDRAENTGSLTQNLAEVNREKYDYTTFLRKFSVMGETLKINPDEFDYIFYTYGLKLYKKIPLIEPLEYKETNLIREFAIVLDTSGSTSGKLVQTFVQKTYNILKQQDTFFTKINLHIIQCDTEIQEDTKITCQRDFDDFMKNFVIRGLGGTDFRPAFSYVDELIKSGEFSDLKGLIYFTDGMGVFPEKQPDYKVAVVFIDEGYAMPQVPVWAIKLVLRPDEVLYQ